LSLFALTSFLASEGKVAGVTDEHRSISQTQVDAKVEALLSQMTLVEVNDITPAEVAKLSIGGVLSGAYGVPPQNNQLGWHQMTTEYQQAALGSRLSIPLLFGVDGVHGHNKLPGTMIFPHNIGLGATRNAELVEKVCNLTAYELTATGVNWNFAPSISVTQDIRWGRTYESYSENTELVTLLGSACVHGLQEGEHHVLATPKHFIGDGGTEWGTSNTFAYMLDQGHTRGDEAQLRRKYLPPYQSAIDAGALSIMASYSRFDDKHMSANTYLLTDVLKNEMGFKGFVVSDWGAVDQISDDYYLSVVTAINAGIDMNMVPIEYEAFIESMKKAVANGDIAQSHIDDAVRRILRAKYTAGIFEHPIIATATSQKLRSAQSRTVARQAVSESLVLLKNERQTFPLPKDVKHIVLAGSAADDIGKQAGGWTVSWQGGSGFTTTGRTILQATREAVTDESVIQHNHQGVFEPIQDMSGAILPPEVGIVVVGEEPYAEGQGDSNDLRLSANDTEVIKRVRTQVDRLVIIIISGRPMILGESLDLADAVVAAWLPGTEAYGITDVMFGDKPFTGKLPFSWPRQMSQLPFSFDQDFTAASAPLFPYGYGLTTN